MVFTVILLQILTFVFYPIAVHFMSIYHKETVVEERQTCPQDWTYPAAHYPVTGTCLYGL